MQRAGLRLSPLPDLSRLVRPRRLRTECARAQAQRQYCRRERARDAEALSAGRLRDLGVEEVDLADGGVDALPRPVQRTRRPAFMESTERRAFGRPRGAFACLRHSRRRSSSHSLRTSVRRVRHPSGDARSSRAKQERGSMRFSRGRRRRRSGARRRTPRPAAERQIDGALGRGVRRRAALSCRCARAISGAVADASWRMYGMAEGTDGANSGGSAAVGSRASMPVPARCAVTAGYTGSPPIPAARAAPEPWPSSVPHDRRGARGGLTRAASRTA
jgi:hypothetical protein